MAARSELAARSLVALLARVATVLAGSVVVFAAAAGGTLSVGHRLEALVLAAVAGSGLVWVAVARPGWVPALVLVTVSLVPYHVSFVGKTPFGVVSAAGAIGAVAVSVLLLRHGRGRWHLVRGADVTALGLWVLVMGASAALSGDPRHALNQVRLVAIGLPLAYIAGRLVAQLDPLAMRRLVLAVGLISLLAILEQLTRWSVYDLVPRGGFPLEPPNPAVRSGLVRVRLGYYHGSTLGTVLAVAVPVVVLCLRRSREVVRWVLPALLVALVFTVTFQVWVATAVASCLLGLGLRRVRLGLVSIGLVAGVAVAVGAVPAVNQLIENRINPTGSHEDEIAYRAQLWPAAIREASDGPVLGEGPGSFNLLGITGTVRNLPVRLVDDNTITTSLVETGYPGLLAMLAAMGLVARRMLRNPERSRAWAGLAALAAWLVMALSVEVLAGDQALLPCWLVLGLLSSYGQGESR